MRDFYLIYCSVFQGYFSIYFNWKGGETYLFGNLSSFIIQFFRVVFLAFCRKVGYILWGVYLHLFLNFLGLVSLLVSWKVGDGYLLGSLSSFIGQLFKCSFHCIFG